jgi:hypothetical protein
MNKSSNKYSKLKHTYREDFFVSYAVRGPEVLPGVRQDMPILTPISGPVTEPSPLNTRWKYIPEIDKVGIL